MSSQLVCNVPNVSDILPYSVFIQYLEAWITRTIHYNRIELKHISLTSRYLDNAVFHKCHHADNWNDIP